MLRPRRRQYALVIDASGADPKIGFVGAPPMSVSVDAEGTEPRRRKDGKWGGVSLAQPTTAFGGAS